MPPRQKWHEAAGTGSGRGQVANAMMGRGQAGPLSLRSQAAGTMLPPSPPTGVRPGGAAPGSSIGGATFGVDTTATGGVDPSQLQLANIAAGTTTTGGYGHAPETVGGSFTQKGALPGVRHGATVYPRADTGQMDLAWSGPYKPAKAKPTGITKDDINWGGIVDHANKQAAAKAAQLANWKKPKKPTFLQKLHGSYKDVLDLLPGWDELVGW